MSTLAAADLDSDDENDQDFKPDEPKSTSHRSKKRRRSGSESSSSSSSGQGDGVESGEAAALRAEQEAAEAAVRRSRAQEAFDAMKAGLPTPTAVTSRVAMVEIQRARRFAGETIYETVQLPDNDPEAIAFLKRNELPGQALSELPLQTTANASAEPVAGPSKKKPPSRRRPRQSLEAMSAALDKGKKMTTLEKSQMDWSNHTRQDRVMNEELEANRKSGGYLQKKEFLDRVGERRMDTFEGKR